MVYSVQPIVIRTSAAQVSERDYIGTGGSRVVSGSVPFGSGVFSGVLPDYRPVSVRERASRLWPGLLVSLPESLGWVSTLAPVPGPERIPGCRLHEGGQQSKNLYC